MKRLIALPVLVASTLSFSGCLLAAAGVGAETAYVATQDDRTVEQTLTDQRITASVKTKLLADSRVSGLNINVDTFKSSVTLKGFVHSQNEADAAIQLAKSVNGVSSVETKLYVDAPKS